MKTAYRAGVIGCGQIGRSHARAYQNVDGVEFVAAADPLERALETMRSEYEAARTYTDYREMLASEKLDLVSVCTWHLLHAEQTITAAQHAPKGIICEKPMASCLESADQMIEACGRKGVKLAIAHQRRFYRSWTKARELIQEGAIGRPLMVTAKSGEGLLNCGTHAVDAIRYLLGDQEVEWVMGAIERKTDRYERDMRTEDNCLALIAFKDGSQGLIQSDLTPQWSVDNYSVRGEDGVMDITATGIRMLRGDSPGWEHIETEYGEPWVCQVKETVNWIEGRSGHRNAARQSRQTLEVLMALYQSARNHEVVRMPLCVKEYPLDLMFAEGKIPVAEHGKYDIRAFLAMEEAERQTYTELRQQGKGHREVLAHMGKLPSGG